MERFDYFVLFEYHVLCIDTLWFISIQWFFAIYTSKHAIYQHNKMRQIVSACVGLVVFLPMIQ